MQLQNTGPTIQFSADPRIQGYENEYRIQCLFNTKTIPKIAEVLGPDPNG